MAKSIQDTKLKDYEMILILKDTPKDGLSTIWEEIENSLKKRKVENISKEDWGPRKLYHPPKENETGIFHFVQFKANGSEISKINQDFKMNNNILKSLICKTKAVK